MFKELSGNSKPMTRVFHLLTEAVRLKQAGTALCHRTPDAPKSSPHRLKSIDLSHSGFPDESPHQRYPDAMVVGVVQEHRLCGRSLGPMDSGCVEEVLDSNMLGLGTGYADA
jgi:hypothetical protein